MPIEQRGNVNLVESQSSQVLDFVLGNAVPPAAGNNKSDQNTSADRASAGVSESSGSAPRYHFHGLAATQTESQFTDNASKEDSQKENTPALSLNGQYAIPSPVKSLSSSDKSNNTPPPRAAPSDSLTGSGSSAGPLSTRQPLQETAPFKTTKAVTFISPAPPSPQVYKVPQPPMRFRHHRSPSPSSQDSFAGPSRTQDPDLFVASSRQFEKPLDELGQSQSQSQEDSQSLSVVPRSMATRRVVNLQGHREMRSSDETKPYSISSKQESVFGRILVENSDESANNSQASGGAFASQSSDKSAPTDISFPSSSHQTQLATQIVDTSENVIELNTQSTQQSTQQNTQNSADLNAGSTQIVADSSPREPNTFQPFISNAPSALGTEASTNRQSGTYNRCALANVISANLKERYKDALSSYPVSSLQVASTRATAATSTIAAQSNLSAIGPPLERTQRDPQPIIIPSSSPSKAPDQSSKTTHVSETLISEANIPLDPPATSYIRTSSRFAHMAEMDEVIPNSEPDRTTSSSGISRSIRGERSKKDSAEVEADMTEDEDVPLMSAVKKPISGKTMMDKGKQKESTAAIAVPEKGKAKAVSPAILRGRGMLKNDVEVPSSAPHQDVEVAESSTNNKPAKKPGRKKKTPAKAPSPKRTRNAVIRETRKSMGPPEPVNEPDRKTEEVHSEDENAMERQTTEVADEERTDEPYVPPGFQKKRGRSTSESLKGAGTGSVTHAAKRQKTLIAMNNNSNATRVMALWKQDGYYYHGTVYSVDAKHDSKYMIYFDDKTKDNVELNFMRASLLKVDDEIILISSKISQSHKAKVVDSSEWESKSVVTVRYNDAARAVQMEITSTDFKIANRTITAKWKDRTLIDSDILPLVGLKSKGTPSHSVSVASMSSNKVLSGKGFVITITKGDNVAEKERVSGLLRKLGGTVIDDWTDVYSLKGEYFLKTKRWIIKKENIKCIHHGNIEQVFLLSDQYSSKPKFLTALALGIPCISIDYLDDLVKNSHISWRSYMLPAGYALSLSALVSQMVDLHWGNSTEHMRDILSNFVPPRVFEGNSVLCIGADFMPEESTGEEPISSDVGGIILCMGAAEVEAVVSAKSASGELSTYDYVVVKDLALKSTYQNANIVHIDWVKQCLICGRLIPISMNPE